MTAANRRTMVPILVMAMALVFAAMGVLGVLTFRLLNQEVVPALEDNGRVIGISVRDRVAEAVELGIPIDELVGVESYMAQTLGESPAVSALVLVDADGEVVEAAGIERAAVPDLLAAGEARAAAAADVGMAASLMRTAGQLGAFVTGRAADGQALGLVSLDVEANGARVGALHVGIDRLHISRKLRDTAVDIMVVIGITLLLAFEALFLVVSTSLSGPLTQLVRVTARMARRDFSREAVPAGNPMVAGLVRHANDAVRRVNAAAAEVRAGIGNLRAGLAARSGPGSQRRPAGAAVSKLESDLDRLGHFADTSGGSPMTATNLAVVRAAAFLFVLAEELIRPFLPLYLREVTQGVQGVDPALLIALPIAAFMFVMAVAGPVVAAWSDRVGRRRTFLVGAAISTTGLLGTAFAFGFADLMIWRALSGLGYALTFVACQGQVLDQTTEQDRTGGLSIFVGGVLAADICGPAIGGILANQIGYTGTLIAAASVALLAGVLAVSLMENRPRPETQRQNALDSFKAIGRCARNPRFLGTVMLAAVPAKMMLTGFLFFLAPLVLSDLGVSESQIGRMTMIYGLSGLLLMPLFANLCDRLQIHGLMVGAGALISGIGLIPLLFGASVANVAVAILAIGVGQAMSISAQTAFITIVARAETAESGPGPVLGAFRFVERLGSAVGPLVAAQIALYYGYVTTAVVFGFAAITFGTLFSAFFLLMGVAPEADDDSFEAAMETPS